MQGEYCIMTTDINGNGNNYDKSFNINGFVKEQK